MPLAVDVSIQQLSDQLRRHMEIRLLEPLYGGRQIHEALSGRRIEDAESANDWNLTPLGRAATLAFVNEQECGLLLFQGQGDRGPLSATQDSDVGISRHFLCRLDV